MTNCDEDSTSSSSCRSSSSTSAINGWFLILVARATNNFPEKLIIYSARGTANSTRERLQKRHFVYHRLSVIVDVMLLQPAACSSSKTITSISTTSAQLHQPASSCISGINSIVLIWNFQTMTIIWFSVDETVCRIMLTMAEWLAVLSTVEACIWSDSRVQKELMNGWMSHLWWFTA